jgi:hypothetical protein
MRQKKKKFSGSFLLRFVSPGSMAASSSEQKQRVSVDDNRCIVDIVLPNGESWSTAANDIARLDVDTLSLRAKLVCVGRKQCTIPFESVEEMSQFFANVQSMCRKSKAHEANEAAACQFEIGCTKCQWTRVRVHSGCLALLSDNVVVAVVRFEWIRRLISRARDSLVVVDVRAPRAELVSFCVDDVDSLARHIIKVFPDVVHRSVPSDDRHRFDVAVKRRSRTFSVLPACLAQLDAAPRCVIDADDVALVYIARAGWDKVTTFDIDVVFRDLTRPIARLEAAPMSALGAVCSWCRRNQVLAFIAPHNLVWPRVLKLVLGDVRYFGTEFGGWLGMFGPSSEGGESDVIDDGAAYTSEEDEETDDDAINEVSSAELRELLME